VGCGWCGDGKSIYKHCKFNANIRCWHFSCDFIDRKGNIRVCKHFLGSSDHFMRRKFSPFSFSATFLTVCFVDKLVMESCCANIRFDVEPNRNSVSENQIQYEFSWAVGVGGGF